jgi:ribosome-binding ATPase YchF (GTP1/OBG family)
MDSTSLPTYPTSVNFEASTFTKGAFTRVANRLDISVFPTPVEPMRIILLGLISFFTVGEDECRSWPIRKGTNAQKAAGVIHTDLEKGFIRAETVHYDDLIREGSMQACKEKGLLRLEGKDYIVQDGDILNIRFNV